MQHSTCNQTLSPRDAHLTQKKSGNDHMPESAIHKDMALGLGTHACALDGHYRILKKQTTSKVARPTFQAKQSSIGRYMRMLRQV